MKEMDIKNIVTTIHHTRIMVDLLMDERQKELAKFSHFHTVQDEFDKRDYLTGILKYKYLNFREKHKKFIEDHEGRYLAF